MQTSENNSDSASTLIKQQSEILCNYAPFANMLPEHVETLLQSAKETYFHPQEKIIDSTSGEIDYVFIIKQGIVQISEGVDDGKSLEAGDLFPVNAASQKRAVVSSYKAVEDCFFWKIDYADLLAVAAVSKPLSDFLNDQALHLLKLSQKLMQASYSEAALTQFSHLRTLSEISHKKPANCFPDTPTLNVLQIMHERRIGSMLIVDSEEKVLGIFTRKDILGKVAIKQLPLDTPISELMTSPVHNLTTIDTFEDATILMSRLGVRHVPIVDPDTEKLISIISERDLFAMQRLSLKKVVSTANEANIIDDLVQVAKDIRDFAANMVSQGVQTKTLTEMISNLNDALTERLIQIVFEERGLDVNDMCWLSFGSEGRGEQTIATDQDNGLIFQSDNPDEDRKKWMEVANEINVALDKCGYPLCKGKIMANQPLCCLTLQEWKERFRTWIERGTPKDLLACNIYFDFRAVNGNLELADELLESVIPMAQKNQRFIKMLAGDVLRRQVGLNWLGNLNGVKVDGIETIDLKLSGTAIFVDAARVMALSQGVPITNTRDRLILVAETKKTPAKVYESWLTSFDYLQSLRLSVQMSEDAVGRVDDHPNSIVLSTLNNIDRKLLKESLLVAKSLQKMLEIRYGNY